MTFLVQHLIILGLLIACIHFLKFSAHERKGANDIAKKITWGIQTRTGEISINQKPTCDMLVKHVEVGYMHLSITLHTTQNLDSIKQACRM